MLLGKEFCSLKMLIIRILKYILMLIGSVQWMIDNLHLVTLPLYMVIL